MRIDWFHRTERKNFSKDQSCVAYSLTVPDNATLPEILAAGYPGRFSQRVIPWWCGGDTNRPGDMAGPGKKAYYSHHWFFHKLGSHRPGAGKFTLAPEIYLDILAGLCDICSGS